MTPDPAHNHLTRDVKAPGLCPACDITPTSPDPTEALVLTESEWECLRGIAGFYLGSDGGADDSYDLCRRVLEATPTKSEAARLADLANEAWQATFAHTPGYVGRSVRVVRLTRNTAWGRDPKLSYELRQGESVLHADHGYSSGNVEWLTLVIEGPSPNDGSER